MRIGSLEVQSVWDGFWTFPVELMFPSQAPEDWARHETHLDPDGRFRMDVGGYLVRTDTRTMLVDLGYGAPTSFFPQFEAKFLESLAALGQSPVDITDVILTHLHFDHFGLASRDGRPVFPNATYRCHLKDWDVFVTEGAPQPFADALGLPSANAGHWLDPVQDRLEPWAGDTTIAPGIDVLDAPGHTPGHSVVLLSSGGDRALLLGDVVHTPVELVEPAWQMIGDDDPAQSRRTRDSLVSEFAGTDTRIAAGHFPDLRFGRLVTDGENINWLYE